MTRRSENSTNQTPLAANRAPATVADSLERLMERYVGGESAAFDELYTRLAPRVLGSLVPLTGDRARAEDVLQSTFLKVHRARATYIPGSPVLPWVLVIAKRTWFDEQRPLAARLETLTSDGVMNDSAAEVTEVNGDVQSRVRSALDQLPSQYRDAIELTRLSGYSGQEAALSLNTTAAAIKQRVHRGYALLRQLLSNGNGEPMPA